MTSYVTDALGTLEDLLCSVARGLPPNPREAGIYSSSRSDLLGSPAKDLLPGFLYQCLTIFKFRDFITLFDPDVALREAFVRRTFERCRAMMASRPAVPPAVPPAAAAEDRSDPQRWML